MRTLDPDLARCKSHDSLAPSLELALVDDADLSARLETAYGRMTKVLALTIPERETIVRALDDARRVSRSSVQCCSASTSVGCGTGWSSWLSAPCGAESYAQWWLLRRCGLVLSVEDGEREDQEADPC